MAALRVWDVKADFLRTLPLVLSRLFPCSCFHGANYPYVDEGSQWPIQLGASVDPIQMAFSDNHRGPHSDPLLQNAHVWSTESTHTG